jgi:hypothetical protein
MGIRDKPIAPASPWQNGFGERLAAHFVALAEKTGMTRDAINAILKSIAERSAIQDSGSPMLRATFT